MSKRDILTIAAVAISALAVGQVQAATINVPNGTFHMYKPGTSYTVSATFPEGNIWTTGMGDNAPINGDLEAIYGDGTTGKAVDVPGWITPIESNGNPTNTCDLFTFGYDDTDGSSCLNAFGGWSGGNGTLAESADSLGNIVGGTIYTVSAMINGDGGPFTLELRAGGVAMTPSSSVNPITSTSGTSGWEVISTTYTADIAYAGQPITIVAGTKRPAEGEDPLYGGRSRLDNVTLTATRNYGATNPAPADGSRTPPSGLEGDGYYMVMSFTPGCGATTHTAYFSSTFDDVNDRNPAVRLGSPPYSEVPEYETTYYVGLDDPVVPEFARTPLERGVTYYWSVDESNDTDSYPGHVWSYTIAGDSAWDPTPADGEEMVPIDGTMTWTLGDLVTTGLTLTYDVYIGTDETAVADANFYDNPSVPEYMGNVNTESYDYADLDPETEIFWRVDTKLAIARPPFTPTITPGVVWSFTTMRAGVGHILREWWTGIPGVLVSDLASNADYPSNPTGSELVDLFEGPTDVMDDYGSRIHGWLSPLQTGDYTFWIATDDGGELWLSTDATQANASLIAYVTGWAASRDWDSGAVTPSGPIHLEAGNMYYISGLMKEGSGGDNIAVAWECLDNGIERDVIPGYVLMLYTPVLAESPDPANNAVDIAPNVTLSWTAGIDENTDMPYTTQHVYVGSDPVAVAAATTASPEYLGGPTGPNEYGPLSLGHYEDVYWRIDGVVASSGEVEYAGAAWTFRTIIDPAWASNPNPNDGATGVDGNATLSWTPGAGATAHTVYFGADDPANMVQAAGPSTSTTYAPPGSLDLGTTYYWRVVESPGGGEGLTWQFTTSDYLVLDDMESYTPWTIPNNNIFEIWLDGFGDCAGSGNGTGAVLTENADPVLGGFQSMKYDFDNDGTVYSPCSMAQESGHLMYSRIEAQTATLPSGIGSDWTISGVKALSINFQGQAGNTTTESLWVQLQDGTNGYGEKVFYGTYEGESLDDFDEASWHNWNIDLNDFDVDLTNVVSIVIGIGNEDGSGTHGSGTLYLDDIRLYTPRCVLARRSADFAILDYGQDCVVDYKELAVMAENWLTAAGTVPNGDFELLYKPGTAITGNVSQWTQGVGPDCPIDTGEYVFSDATTGTVADIPGWIGYDRQGWIDNGGTYERDQTTGNLQGSISDEQNYTPDGSQCYLANGGGYGNPAGGLIVSDTPLRNVEDGIYTLSMMANGDATPVVLDLLAGGIPLTPTSSADPVLSGDWQEFSRTYDSASLVGFLGEPLTICLGLGREASGGQTRFDNVTLFHSEDKKINFKDFAELAVWWLEEQLWPLP